MGDPRSKIRPGTTEQASQRQWHVIYTVRNCDFSGRGYSPSMIIITKCVSISGQRLMTNTLSQAIGARRVLETVLASLICNTVLCYLFVNYCY
jgi:hypothetical protein